MSWATRLILGASILVVAIGCDDGGSTDDGPKGPKPVSGSDGGTGNGATTSGTSGTGSVVPPGTSGSDSGPTTGGSSSGGTESGASGSGTATGGSGAGGSDPGPLPEGVPLTPTAGWVDGASNEIGVQGAMFAFYDATSGMGIVEDFTEANACIKGTAAKVDMKCTPVAPAVDCYGTYWGAAIGLNLNQAIDPVSGMGSMTPEPFDASALTGFAFEISGTKIPTSLRFKVEDASGEFCTPTTKPVKLGVNKVLFTELLTQCWKPTTMSKNADSAKSGLVKIAWQVVTNAMSAIPFDYCVSNVRALR
jgi:hypothetical protein